MDRQLFNESGEPTILFVMGVGNRIDGANERWFIEKLTDAGYRVQVIQLATDTEHFEREYRDPIQRIHDECDPEAVLGHSLGGLITAYLETSAQSVYLAPWWGIYERKVSAWERWFVPRLPIGVPILPIKTRRSEIGTRLPTEDWNRLPKRLSPKFITEIYRAQQNRPPISDDAVVFVSCEDTIISLHAIGAAVAADQIRLYDGGHQLFSTSGRTETVKEVLAVLPA
jgi:hypothetical protein